MDDDIDFHCFNVINYDKKLKTENVSLEYVLKPNSSAPHLNTSGTPERIDPYDRLDLFSYSEQDIMLPEEENWYDMVKSKLDHFKYKWKKIINYEPQNEKPYCMNPRMVNTDIEARYSNVHRTGTNPFTYQAVKSTTGRAPTVEKDFPKLKNTIPAQISRPRLVSTFHIGGREYNRMDVDKGFVSARAIRDRNLRARTMTPGGLTLVDPMYGTGYPLRFKPNETEFTCGHPQLPELWEKRRTFVQERGDKWETFGELAAGGVAGKAAEPEPAAPKMSTSAESIAPPTLGKTMDDDGNFQAVFTVQGSRYNSTQNMYNMHIDNEKSSSSVKDKKVQKSVVSIQSSDKNSMQKKTPSQREKPKPIAKDFSSKSFCIDIPTTKMTSLEEIWQDTIFNSCTNLNVSDGLTSKQAGKMKKQSKKKENLYKSGTRFKLPNKENFQKMKRRNRNAYISYATRDNSVNSSVESLAIPKYEDGDILIDEESYKKYKKGLDTGLFEKDMTYFTYCCRYVQDPEKQDEEEKEKQKALIGKPLNYKYGKQSFDPERDIQNFYRILGAEAFGSFALLAGSVIGSNFAPWLKYESSYCWAGMYSLLTMTIGHISGAHMNPIVTFGVFVAGFMKMNWMIFYIIIQFMSMWGAAYFVKFWFPLEEYYQSCKPGYRKLQHRPWHTRWRAHEQTAAALELIMCFLLVLVYLAAGAARRTASPGIFPSAVALLVLVCHFLTFELTGTGLNPARCYATSLLEGRTGEEYIYYFAGICGGALAGMIFRVFCTLHPNITHRFFGGS